MPDESAAAAAKRREYPNYIGQKGRLPTRNHEPSRHCDRFLRADIEYQGAGATGGK